MKLFKIRAFYILFMFLAVSSLLLTGCQALQGEKDNDEQTPDREQSKTTILPVESISTENLLLLSQAAADIDGDGQDENVEMYAAAERNSKGEIMWDDGQNWLLLVRDEDKDYVLFQEYIQLGELHFWLYTSGKDNEYHIATLQPSSAGMRFSDYVFDKGKNGFIKTVYYNPDNVNLIYSSTYEDGHTGTGEATIVAENPDEKAVLSAVERDGMYEDFTLDINGSKRSFDWENVNNPTFAPQLLSKDVNRDGRKELIIILTTATGTGVNVTKAHVIDPKTLVEAYIEDPKAIILKDVKTKITQNEVDISIGGQKTTIDIKDLKIKPENLSSDVSFDSICSFEVVDDELRANVGAQISPASFVGSVQITYMFKDNMYQAGKIEFKEDQN